MARIDKYRSPEVSRCRDDWLRTPLRSREGKVGLLRGKSGRPQEVTPPFHRPHQPRLAGGSVLRSDPEGPWHRLFHSRSILSARYNTDRGIVRPISFAAFRLMT